MESKHMTSERTIQGGNQATARAERAYSDRSGTCTLCSLHKDTFVQLNA